MSKLSQWLRKATKRMRHAALVACLPRGLYFSKLGRQGRLGNQLFQYAMLRTMARRLGARYYCPRWAGDELFDLRESARIEIPFQFNGPEQLSVSFTDRFERLAETIEQKYRGNVHLSGHPDAEHLFDPVAARSWFQLRRPLRQTIESRYWQLDFENTVSLHVRLKPPLNTKDKVVCQLPYYRSALELTGCENVLVFSDDLPAARDLLQPLLSQRKFIFQSAPNGDLLPEVQDFEDIHLMSLCRDNIICVSTYSWWGAWMNNHADKTVVCPEPWFHYHGPREYPRSAGAGWTRLHTDGELGKQFVIVPQGTAAERRAVILSAQIWAEHLHRELCVLWRRDKDCDLPYERALPGCRVELAEFAPSSDAACRRYTHFELVNKASAAEVNEPDAAPLLALPSSLAGYETTLLVATSSPFRPAWMPLAEYRTEIANQQERLFAIPEQSVACPSPARRAA
jgi:hypothetical protein